jgi:hypothetical protein
MCDAGAATMLELMAWTLAAAAVADGTRRSRKSGGKELLWLGWMAVLPAPWRR